MGTLYFQRSNGKEVLIKENLAENDVGKAIIAAVAEMNPNYKIYYTRHWTSTEDPRTIVYDVGSHTEFFLYQKADSN